MFEQTKALCQHFLKLGIPSIGYGLGMRAPRQDPNHTEFGWGGAAGAFASVDPVNNIAFFYAQHVITAPNRP